jgi:tRNA (cmo5U34)-methyltransferase
MLDRAQQRVQAATKGAVETIYGDVRDIELGERQFDIVLAAAVLHHLREESEWRQVFSKIYKSMKPGGSFWISDLVSHEDMEVQSAMWQRYGEYLTGLKDETYRDRVFAYVEKEDTPRPVTFQMDLLREVGFRTVDILHKNGPFAAFGAVL